MNEPAKKVYGSQSNSTATAANGTRGTPSGRRRLAIRKTKPHFSAAVSAIRAWTACSASRRIQAPASTASRWKPGV